MSLAQSQLAQPRTLRHSVAATASNQAGAGVLESSLGDIGRAGGVSPDSARNRSDLGRAGTRFTSQCRSFSFRAGRPATRRRPVRGPPKVRRKKAARHFFSRPGKTMLAPGVAGPISPAREARHVRWAGFGQPQKWQGSGWSISPAPAGAILWRPTSGGSGVFQPVSIPSRTGITVNHLVARRVDAQRFLQGRRWCSAGGPARSGCRAWASTSPGRRRGWCRTARCRRLRRGWAPQGQL